MTSSSLRERKKADRRQRIFECAMQLFEERGFQATTFDAIARSAGVSRGTVFNYFPYKEALLIEFFGRHLESLRRALQRRRSRDGLEPLEELYVLFEALARFVDTNRGLVLPLSYELLNPDPERSRAAYLALPLGDLLLDVLARARAAGRVREDYSRERLARMLANVYFITVMQWAAYRQDRSIRDELHKALTLTLQGIERQSAGVADV